MTLESQLRNAQWQATLDALEKIAKDPNETPERRKKASEALRKSERGSSVRSSNSRAWGERQQNNYGSGDKRYGGTA